MNLCYINPRQTIALTNFGSNLFSFLPDFNGCFVVFTEKLRAVMHNREVVIFIVHGVHNSLWHLICKEVLLVNVELKLSIDLLLMKSIKREIRLKIEIVLLVARDMESTVSSECSVLCFHHLILYCYDKSNVIHSQKYCRQMNNELSLKLSIVKNTIVWYISTY